MGVWLSVADRYRAQQGNGPGFALTLTTVLRCSRLILMRGFRYPGAPPKVGEALLCPPNERVALAVALKVALQIKRHSVVSAVVVDHHRMIDDEVNGDQRIYNGWVSAQVSHGIPECGEVGERGHASGVVHQHAFGEIRR